MSLPPFERNNQQISLLQEQRTASASKEKMPQKARWFLLVIISIEYIVSLSTGIVGFFITRDTQFLLLVSPALSMDTTLFLLSMHLKIYGLKRLTRQCFRQQKEQRMKTDIKQTNSPENRL